MSGGGGSGGGYCCHIRDSCERTVGMDRGMGCAGSLGSGVLGEHEKEMDQMVDEGFLCRF